MKARSLFIGVILVLCSFAASGQVYEMYYQGFEAGEAARYTVTSNSFVVDNSFHVSGLNSIKLVQSRTENVEFISDTVDLSGNSTLRYISLEFDHICNLAQSTTGGTAPARIYVKRANQSDFDYVQLAGNDYSGSSTEFPSVGFFNNYSYDEWFQNSTLTNEHWKHERFDMNNIITSSVPINERKLIFKFVVTRRTVSSNPGAAEGWRLDNVQIKASPSQMVSPQLDMVLYPDGGAHPSSRGARVVLDASTTLAQGINADSVYLYYKVGSDSTQVRLQLTPMGSVTHHDGTSAQRFGARIPFFGYDTLMQFYCVVKDATTNANSVTFPAAANSWVSYWCVRGNEVAGTSVPANWIVNGSHTACPFTPLADSRTEWIYDSVNMARGGYAPGAITAMNFVIAGNTQASDRQNFQIRMKNAPTSHTSQLLGGSLPQFTLDYMQVVYDSTFHISEAAAGAMLHVDFQDTFYYAGKDLVVQIIYNGTGSSNPAAASIRTMGASTNKQTKWFMGYDADLNANIYIDNDAKTASELLTIKPVTPMRQHLNQPLVYDLGVASLVFPSSDSSVITQPTHIKVELKNYGAATANAIRISYAIDDSVTGHYDWAGTLAGGASQEVTVATGIRLDAGYHTLRAWVEDTLTAGGSRYRDHEPLNDTSFTEFIACAGSLAGVRTIGGTNPDYADIREFLFSLSRCGVGDSLVVKLAPGYYEPFTMPAVGGLAGSSYIVFQPLSGEVVMYADEAAAATEIVNLEAVQNIRFRNIKFVRRSGTLTNMVTLGGSSHNCQFYRCTFVDSMDNPTVAQRITAMINASFANNLTVDTCVFVGGGIGVNALGQAADLHATNLVVRRCEFRNQLNSALNVRNMTGVTVEKNQMYDVMSNSSYVALFYACTSPFRVVGNKMYSTHGAGVIGISNVGGLSGNRAFVANNMVVCHDDGTSNLLTTPINVIEADQLDVVYNSVSMTATARSNVAAATFGGSWLSNSRFMNNIVACFDETNYALNYMPGTESSNTVSNNVYYSQAYTLNRYAGTAYGSLAAWQAAVPGDASSVMLNPGFLNGGTVDLRTYNRLIKGLGTPVTGITTDMFGTARDAQHPCPGAFEFVSLQYDFEPEGLTSPVADTCDMPASVELVVRVRNNGVNAFTASVTNPLNVSYRINGGSTNTVSLTSGASIPADDTVSLHTGRMLQLPTNGTKDSTYTIKVWVRSSRDPNGTNDTNEFTVVSRYHQPAPSNVTLSIPYATATQVVPTTGVQQWAVYNASTAPQVKSKIYWYTSMDAEPFYVGDTLQTEVLRQDTHYYFRQRRDLPIVRITQVQLKPNNAVGLSNPMPRWMNANTKFAVQLTNVGDDTAFLYGDTLLTVSPTSNINNKFIAFGEDAYIAPGKALVVQYVTGTADSVERTVHTGATVSPAANANIGIIYRHNGKVADAVALNGVTTASTTATPRWATQNIPSYVWSGSGLTVTPTTTGGIIRKAFNGNSADWQLATAASPMYIGDVNPSWIRYVDNGCPTEFATATINLQSAPTVDVAVFARELAEGCGLGNESVSVDVRNYGTLAVSGVQMHYNAGGSTVTEAMSSAVPANGSVQFTFATPLNMSVPHDSTFNVRVWATVSGDTYTVNDSCTMTAVSLFRPGLPTLATPRSVNYGSRDTVVHAAGTGMVTVWYDSLGNPVDTANTYITDQLFQSTTLGVGYMVGNTYGGQIGTDATITSKNEYPSPYQPTNRFVKQQFIYSASELKALGLQAGELHAVSFHIDSIWALVAGRELQTRTYNNFSIALGQTQDTIFAAANSWVDADVVYQRDQFTFTNYDESGTTYTGFKKWIKHDFDRPYVWDGESSIVVQVVFENAAAITSGMQTGYTQKNNTCLIRVVNAVPSPSTIGYVGNGTKTHKRPNIKIEQNIYGCVGPVKPITINVAGTPQYDAKLSWPSGYDTLTFNSCSNLLMKVDVQNLGLNSISNFALRYSIDGGSLQTSTVTSTIASGATSQLQLFNRHFAPGRHHVKAIVSVSGDNMHDNDTIDYSFVVNFCGGQYTIGTAASADYHSFGEAVDTLNNSGVDGAVVFNVAAGTYSEQLMLQEVAGASANNTITFRGESDSTVILTASTSQAANYVLQVDGTSYLHIEDMTIDARPTASNVNFANAVVMQNAKHVTFEGAVIRVKGTINNANASCMVLQGNVSNLNIIDSWLDSGYFSIKNTGTVTDYNTINITGSKFTNFWNRGIELQDVTNINISGNEIVSGVTINNRALVGISLSTVDSAFMISKNKIYLIDERSGAKQGILLTAVKGSSRQNGYIVNNMIGLSGTAVSGLSNAGGISATDCEFINIYYNTIRVYSGTANGSRGIYLAKTSTGVTSDIKLMNNLISNVSSYALYVQDTHAVSISDYNNYYTAAANVAFWQGNCADLNALQLANNRDVNSMSEEPYFVADNDLHLMMTNFSGRAQYNPDVIDDIDGNIRTQVPQPTVGAHQLNVQNRNMTVVRIISPVMPVNKNNPNNIETDSVMVKVRFYNNGSSTETNAYWYAYIEGEESRTRSINKYLGNMLSAEMKDDSVMIPTPLGLIDTQAVRVILVSENDADSSDNEMTADLYLAPAFDIETQKITLTRTNVAANIPNGCQMQQTAVSLTIKNVGFKDIPQGQPLLIGYHAQAYYPNYQAANPNNNRISISTMPDTVTETYTFDAALPKGQPRTINFSTTANLYPTDTVLNIKVRVNGWSTYQYDVVNTNDSTGAAAQASPVVDAFYTPAAPVGFDTTFAYGTWGEVRAMQASQRPIRWYRDSTAAPFYSVSGTNLAAYNSSCRWSSTPRYFHDSTYYLQCLSDKNCPSTFSSVTVHVNPQIPIDVAMEDVLAPLGNRVYMENDTVRVRIANYGTQPINAIPITYELRAGNNTNPIQTVTETAQATIPVGQTYVYTFDSLLQFTNPLVETTYQLRVYTSLEGDLVRRNDTLRYVERLRPAANNNTLLDYTFKKLKETTYTIRTNDPAANKVFDIARVSFNEIDVDIPPMGRSFTNFGVFSNPDWPVLHLTRGTKDTMIVSIVNAYDQGSVDRGKVAVYIDFDRSGTFDEPSEQVVPSTVVFTNSEVHALVTVPQWASYGYMKMRVVCCAYDKEPSPTQAAANGHMVDFLVFVDPEAPTSDLAITQIVTPRSGLLRNGNPVEVSFRIANKGRNTITSADISYLFRTREDLVNVQTFTWTGSLAPGTSTVASLPAYSFPEGTTYLSIWHSLDGDANHANDTLRFEYHRFHRLTLAIDDNFDSIDYWYAPEGNNVYAHNYWQRGVPSKSRLAAAYSEPNVWATDLQSNIVTGTRGNLSYLYSPIFDISQVKSDTLSLYLLRNLINNSSMYVEFYAYDNTWMRMIDTVDNHWYNNEDGYFNGTSNNYTKYWISTNRLSGDFNESLQFRFVYTAPQLASGSGSFGEGCAIDNFQIKRAQRRIDVGVVDVVEPTAPRYGQTYYPRVVVKNYGYDTVRNMQLGYTYYGTYLAPITSYSCNIAPGKTDTITFETPFVVTSDFPDTFYFNAFTIISADIYRDNDTLKRMFLLSPLNNDIEVTDFVYPRANVIGGDSVEVTLRIRNFGISDISTARLSYIVQGGSRVDEEVDFEEVIGHPLRTREYFNYTFKQKFRGAMGMMTLTGIVKCDSNDYVYNDTITMRTNGISSITDLAAVAVVVDTSGHNNVYVQLMIENRGARGANNFEVGFYFDNDTTTLFRQTYYRDEPLVALTSTTHLFDTVMETRNPRWDTFVAWVHIDGDNDPTNDTTTLVVPQYVDVEILGLKVEETAEPDCRVFIQLRNIGNLTLTGKTLPLRATVNGNNLSDNVMRRLEPGVTNTVEFSRTIPKDPNRRYVGTGRIQNLAADINPLNNESSRVTVVNHIEGTPTVTGGDLTLGQNYPNPFSHTTTVPFSLPDAAQVRFFVMDAMGKIVNRFEVSGNAGDNTVELNMDSYPSGVYYYGIEVDGERRMRKLILR